MAKTDTKTQAKKNTAPIDHGDVAGGEVVLATGGARMRLPYPATMEEYAGVDKRTWGVLINAVWPSARTVEAVCLAIAYCKQRNLDPLKRPIHIVPVWSKTGGADGKGGEIETVWPGISELRTTAVRTGVYAGKDGAEFGPDIDQTFSHTNNNETETVKVKFPEWCRITVYKIVHGVRCPFVGPKVYWLESYATKSKWSEVPNEMWADRKSGQLEKCAEAAALRAAFPEEIGNDWTAEEMHGQVIDGPGRAPRTIEARLPGEVVPPRPRRSEFAREDKVHDDPKPTKQEPQQVPLQDTTPVEAATQEVPAETVENPPRQINEEVSRADDEVDLKEQRETDRQDWIKDMYAELDLQSKVTSVADLMTRAIDAGAFTPEEQKAWEKACDDKNKAIMAAARAKR